MGFNKGTIENATFDGSKVIYFIKCNTNGGGGIVPLLKIITKIIYRKNLL